MTEERGKIVFLRRDRPLDPELQRTKEMVEKIGRRTYSPEEILRIAAVLNRRTHGFEKMRAALTGQADELVTLRDEFPELRPLFDTFERKRKKIR